MSAFLRVNSAPTSVIPAQAGTQAPAKERSA